MKKLFLTESKLRQYDKCILKDWTPHQDFSDTLKSWIKTKNLLQKNCASIIQIPERTLRRWLSGNPPHPDRQAIIIQRMKEYKP